MSMLGSRYGIISIQSWREDLRQCTGQKSYPKEMNVKTFTVKYMGPVIGFNSFAEAKGRQLNIIPLRKMRDAALLKKYQVSKSLSSV